MNKQFIFKKEDKFNKWVYSFLGNLFFTYCVIIALALIMFSAVTIECIVDGTSMQPTLNAYGGTKSDVVYVNKYNKDYKIGDIVVIGIGGNNKPIIKRIVGLYNDVIDIVETDNGYMLERNGKLIEESYLNNIGYTVPAKEQNGMKYTFDKWQKYKEEHPEEFNSDGKMVVGENKLFVLGDNRSVSFDSSARGTFDESQVWGIVERTRYYGENEFAFYYNYIIKGEFLKTIANVL